jgi:magnesium-transporting ATPase (P-type)
MPQRRKNKIKMITGDHALTASAIAKSIGIIYGEGANYLAVTGKELDGSTTNA